MWFDGTSDASLRKNTNEYYVVKSLILLYSK